MHLVVTTLLFRMTHPFSGELAQLRHLPAHRLPNL